MSGGGLGQDQEIIIGIEVERGGVIIEVDAIPTLGMSGGNGRERGKADNITVHEAHVGAAAAAE